jgi:hypothetical protein
MKPFKNHLPVVLSLGTGVAAAFLAAPLFHSHSPPDERLSAIWAHQYGSLTEMAGDVDAVVLGRVTQTIPGRTVEFADGRPALPFTFVDLEVTEVVRGQAPAYVTVEQTGGGFLGTEVYFEDDGGPYVYGQQVLLFLKEQEGTGFHYLAHPAGRFSVEDGRLLATLPDHPAAQALDRRSLEQAKGLIRD